MRTLGVLGSTRFSCVFCTLSRIFRSAFSAAFGKRAGRRFNASVKMTDAMSDVSRKLFILFGQCVPAGVLYPVCYSRLNILSGHRDTIYNGGVILPFCEGLY